MKLRKILLLLALTACATVNGNAQDCCKGGERVRQGMPCCKVDARGNGGHCCHRDTAMTGEVSPSTLIIYYSGNSKKVLKLAKKIGAKVLYNYNSFNAVAIRKPDDLTLAETKERFEKLKGVLQVTYDHICHLY